MDKKKFASWGVSLLCLVLVACMVSYLGYTNNETLNKSTIAQTINQSSNQQSQSVNGENQNNINNAYNNDGTLTILSGNKGAQQQKPFTDEGQQPKF